MLYGKSLGLAFFTSGEAPPGSALLTAAIQVKTLASALRTTLNFLAASDTLGVTATVRARRKGPTSSTMAKVAPIRANTEVPTAADSLMGSEAATAVPSMSAVVSIITSGVAPKKGRLSKSNPREIAVKTIAVHVAHTVKWKASAIMPYSRKSSGILMCFFSGGETFATSEGVSPTDDSGFRPLPDTNRRVKWDIFGATLGTMLP
mmetsp:Transcript_60201/g.136112  ORF Transcript_60201/g.136112 Transcript_60201/m.136112 type:complete len:205 (+) Transcript_60201:221-835(+)